MNVDGYYINPNIIMAKLLHELIVTNKSNTYNLYAQFKFTKIHTGRVTSNRD